MFKFFWDGEFRLFLRKNKFIIAGIFFVLLQLLLFYKYIFLARFSNILWFCSHSAIVFAIAFFSRKISVIKAVISVGLLIQFFWILDFFGKLCFGVFIFGATDYMFLGIPFFSYITAIFEHFLSCILALFLTYEYETEKKVLFYSFVYLVVLLVFSRLFSGSNFNYNFVYHIPLFNNFTFPGYQFAWIFLAMLIVVLPAYFMQVWLHKHYSTALVNNKAEIKTKNDAENN